MATQNAFPDMTEKCFISVLQRYPGQQTEYVTSVITQKPEMIPMLCYKVESENRECHLRRAAPTKIQAIQCQYNDNVFFWKEKTRASCCSIDLLGQFNQQHAHLYGEQKSCHLEKEALFVNCCFQLIVATTFVM